MTIYRLEIILLISILFLKKKIVRLHFANYFTAENNKVEIRRLKIIRSFFFLLLFFDKKKLIYIAYDSRYIFVENKRMMK